MIESLNEAIVLNREALAFCPSGHPCRLDYLINLAAHLSSLYDELGETKDLDEGIALGREALKPCTHGDPRRTTSLNNLACDLANRFERLGEMKDMDGGHRPGPRSP